jgi:hypothetical protein
MSIYVNADPNRIYDLIRELQDTVLYMSSVIEEERRMVDEVRKEMEQGVEAALQEEEAAREIEEQAKEACENAQEELRIADEAETQAQAALEEALSIPEDEDEDGVHSGRAQQISLAQNYLDQAREHLEECRRNVEKYCDQLYPKAVKDHDKTIHWLEDIQKCQAQYEAEATEYEAKIQQQYDDHVREVNDASAKLEAYRQLIEESRRILREVKIFNSGVISKVSLSPRASGKKEIPDWWWKKFGGGSPRELYRRVLFR